jgi:hypothetical protein
MPCTDSIAGLQSCDTIHGGNGKRRDIGESFSIGPHDIRGINPIITNHELCHHTDDATHGRASTQINIVNPTDSPRVEMSVPIY